MAVTLNYAIHFVADRTGRLPYRDTLGLPLKFASPEWTEFATGATTLALHPSSPENPPGTTHLGIGTPDVRGFHATLCAAGVRFTRAPEPLHGITLAEFVDPDGGRGGA